ncbi:MAG: caspase family protein [Rubrivivax sp.]|nr:caspase family protein [Rubrivivax sp.]
MCRAALARLATLAAIAAGAAATPGPAAAEGGKHALLIGNARYAQQPLRNPENDARDLGRALGQLGFQVTLLLNGDRAAMQRAIAAHARRLDEQSLSLVYFGGHGVQAEGRNFLLPIMPPGPGLEKVGELAAQAVSLESLMAPLAVARPRFNLVVLDACRDNPFGDGRLPGGLAPLEAPPNTLLAFATSPGKVAYDGSGANGTYTAHLLRHIGRRDLRIEEVFKLVRAGVLEESRGRQLPWENTALTGELALGAFPEGLPAVGADGPLAWVRDAQEPELRRYLAENRDARTRRVVTRALVALREKAPIRQEALALAARPCEGCPRMRAADGVSGEAVGGAAAGSADGDRAVRGTAAPLWVSSDLVTAGELRRCVEARACTEPADLALADAHDPAQGLSFTMAEQYVAWLNTRSARLRFFVPSEAQWRAVYRASFFLEDGRALFDGRSACRVANLYDESGAAAHRFGWAPLACNDGFADAAPVGLFLPSLLGLFDLVGNLWQWTSTCTEPSPGTGTGTCRAHRLVGGSWATGSQWTWADPPTLAAEPELGAPIFGLRVFAVPR